MKRILHILPQFQPGGGMDRVVMNYFSHIDKTKFQFNVLTHMLEDRTYADQLEQAGGTVCVFPSMSFHHIRSIARQFDVFLSKEHYDVVHCHMANAAFIYLRVAKKHGVPVRILHSHQDHYADTRSHALRNMPLIAAGKRFANRNVACSKAAGDFLFPHQEYQLLRNSIDTTSFKFSQSDRDAWRNAMGYTPQQTIFGIVGRLTAQKNQIFAVQVFQRIVAEHPSAQLVIAGDGDLNDELHHQIRSLNLDKHVCWLGNVSNISEVYMGLDALLFPSLYEGLPMTLVEAQAAGLTSYVSNTISDESFISEFVNVLPIDKGAAPWVKAVNDRFTKGSTRRGLGAQQVKDAGFDIADTTAELEMLYEKN
ncbi:glycosyltransferase [Bifidobacterium mongoliense]|uniref:glycosyltransferase n=1 Tax=Bifidobacterium mongoliense TaxID=518643 RepID=UPI0030EE8A9E